MPGGFLGSAGGQVLSPIHRSQQRPAAAAPPPLGRHSDGSARPISRLTGRAPSEFQHPELGGAAAPKPSRRRRSKRCADAKADASVTQHGRFRAVECARNGLQSAEVIQAVESLVKNLSSGFALDGNNAGSYNKTWSVGECLTLRFNFMSERAQL